MSKICVVVIADSITEIGSVPSIVGDANVGFQYLLLVSPVSKIRMINGFTTIELKTIDISTVARCLLEVDGDAYYFANTSLNFNSKVIKHFSRSVFDVQVFGGESLSFKYKKKEEPNHLLTEQFIFHLLAPENLLLSKHAIEGIKSEINGNIEHISQAIVANSKSICVNTAQVTNESIKCNKKINAIINSALFFSDSRYVDSIYSTVLNPVLFCKLIGSVDENSASMFVGFMSRQLDELDMHDMSFMASQPFFAQWIHSIKKQDVKYFIGIVNRIKQNKFYATKTRMNDFSGSGATLDDPDFSYVRSKTQRIENHSDIAVDYSIIGEGEFGRHRDGWNFVMQSLLSSIPHSSSSIGFDGFLEKTFVWNYGLEAVGRNKHWFGITHRPIDIPEFYGWKDRLKFYQSPYFNVHAETLRGLITVSSDHADYLRSIFDVPIVSILHPTNFNVPKWNINALDMPRLKLVQIGAWLRKLHSIFRLPAGNYHKCVLAVKERMFSDDRFIAEGAFLSRSGELDHKCYDTVEFLGFLEDYQYDQLLTNSVVFLDMFSATANNTILECIARHTPIVVRRMPSTVEYLGEAYPLFFDTLPDAAELASNRDLILKAHKYLEKRAALYSLHTEGFVKNFSAAVKGFL